MKRIVLPIISLFMLGCGNDPLPKPKGYLRLEYPEAEYKKVESSLPFSFDKNAFSASVSKAKTSGNIKGINVKYPSLKATIYLSYKKS